MKDLMLCILSMIILVLLTAPSFSAERYPFAKDPEQKAYNENGDHVGTIKKDGNNFVFYDKNHVSLTRESKETWNIYNREGKHMGRLSMNKSSFRLYDENGKFTGFVLQIKEKYSNNKNRDQDIQFKDEFDYVLTVFTTLNITPEAARLYINTMGAINSDFNK